MTYYRDVHLMLPKELAEVLDQAHNDCLAFLHSKGEPYVGFSDFLVKLLIRGMQSTGTPIEEARLFPSTEKPHE